MAIKIIKGSTSYLWRFIQNVNNAFADGWLMFGLYKVKAGSYKNTLVAGMVKDDEPDPETLEIQVKYFDDEIEKIQKIDVGDWIDLRAAETVELRRGEYTTIRLGVGMILPKGYEAHVLPRSSTPAKFGIMCANSMGVIDNSYNGDADEWGFPAVALRNTVIFKGDRIAQFRIVKNQPAIEFKVADRLRRVSRGGFGSTGTR